MNKLYRQVLAFSALALVSAASYAGITNTKHNLTSTGAGPNKTTGTDQICVFCHTPHGSNTNAPVPLWNKALPTEADAATKYTTYDQLNTSSLDGEVLTVGSVSLACLSCHDGTQAMDNMMNAPGSGPGVGDGSTGVSQGYTWTGVGTLATSPYPNLGTDLTNDHPIGIQYCGGGVSGATTTVTANCVDKDFVTDKIQTKVINTNQVFWIDTAAQTLSDGTTNVGGNTGVREKTDIALYTRTFAARTDSGGNSVGGEGPSVECASCHDPHAERYDTNSVHFMRVTTTGSEICLSCHVK